MRTTLGRVALVLAATAPLSMQAAPASQRDDLRTMLLAPVMACPRDRDFARPAAECAPNQVFVRLRSLLEGRDEGAKQEAIVVLERLWANDKALGLSQRSEFVGQAGFRGQVVELLAPRVRAGQSKVPLADLRQYATSLLRETDRKGTDDTQVQLAIRVIAATDAGDHTPYLRELIRSDRRGLRRTAIVALASMCDDGATKLLREIAGWPLLGPGDLGVVGYALSLRFGPAVSMCNDAKQP